MSANPPERSTVYIVDDDQQMRESLVALLEALGYEVCAFSAPGAFHRYYSREMRGCLLLDVCMPRQSGLQLYEQLRSEKKDLPVIFLTAHADVSTAVAAMKSGAVEFLEKPFDGVMLADRVAKALALDAERHRRDATFADLNRRFARLTPRERETLALIHAGETNKAIASQLSISERAVEMRRASIMRKLQVRSAAEVIDLSTTHRILANFRSTSEGGTS